MSHTPAECTHTWSSWVTEARAAPDGAAYVLVRRCFECEAVEEVPFGRDT